MRTGKEGKNWHRGAPIEMTRGYHVDRIPNSVNSNLFRWHLK